MGLLHGQSESSMLNCTLLGHQTFIRLMHFGSFTNHLQLMNICLFFQEIFVGVSLPKLYIEIRKKYLRLFGRFEFEAT